MKNITKRTNFNAVIFKKSSNFVKIQQEENLFFTYTRISISLVRNPKNYSDSSSCSKISPLRLTYSQIKLFNTYNKLSL